MNIKQIIHVVTEGTAESELLNLRLGQELARKFTDAVTARKKSLDTLVTAYNIEVKSIRDRHLRTLDVVQLRLIGSARRNIGP